MYDGIVPGPAVSLSVRQAEELADVIVLGGPERVAGRLRLRYVLSGGGGNETVRVAFYNVAGGAPGAMIAALPPASLSNTAGEGQADVNLDGIFLPANVAVSFLFDGMSDGGEAMSLLLPQEAPTAGANFVDYYVRQSDGSWTRALLNDGALKANIAFQILGATEENAPVIAQAREPVVSGTTARLSALINASQKSAGMVYFEHALGEAFMQRIGETPLQPGQVEYSATLTGLIPGATYRWRVSAGNQGGRNSSVIQSFVVPQPVPPTAAPRVAEARLDSRNITQATIAARITSDGNPAGTARAVMAAADGTVFTGAEVELRAGTHDYLLVVSGLNPRGAYYGEVRAENALGEAKWSDILTVMDLNFPYILRFDIHSVGAATADVTVVVGSGPVAQWSYKIEYAAGNGPFAQVEGREASGGAALVVERTISNLAPETEYRARVTASNSSGTVTSERSFTTRPQPPELRFGADAILRTAQGIQVSLPLAAGLQAALEASGDLKTWVRLGTAPSTDGRVRFVVSEGQIQFFRAVHE